MYDFNYPLSDYDIKELFDIIYQQKLSNNLYVYSGAITNTKQELSQKEYFDDFVKNMHQLNLFIDKTPKQERIS